VEELRELAGHVWRCASRRLRRSARLLFFLLGCFGLGFLAALGPRGVAPPSIEVHIEVRGLDRLRPAADNDYPYAIAPLKPLDINLPNTYYWQRPVNVGPVWQEPWCGAATWQDSKWNGGDQSLIADLVRPALR
jgi:hypothetical protein